MKTNGPGKYDAACTAARETTHAAGVLLIVIGGNQGNGFSAQLTPDILITVPELLRDMAKQIDQQLAGES